MADTLTTRTEISAEISSFYNRALLKKAIPLFLHTQFGQVQDIPANAGTDTITFRLYGLLTAQTTALTEGVTPTGKQLSITDITATVLRYGDYVTMTDKVLTESIDPVLVQAAEALGIQMADSLDQLCRDIIAAGTNVQYASTASQRTEVTASMKLTRSEIKEAVRTLKNANAKPLTSIVNPTTGYNTTPLRASFIGIVHPNTVFDLEDAEGFVPVEKYPNKGDVMNGEIGYCQGVRFVESTNAKVFTAGGDGGVNVYGTIILAADAFGISRISGHAVENIVTPLGSAGGADPLRQRATSGWKASFVTKILNQNWLVRIEHGVTA